jgi:hypothetical protein
MSQNQRKRAEKIYRLLEAKIRALDTAVLSLSLAQIVNMIPLHKRKIIREIEEILRVDDGY